ncbi:uncharacterized protein C2845_PM01G45330 [Panicum miliaceum]|uniref:Uncharacterized protein n=1 Tax=Panicum miliaceum TaxID=4540 RepID=A0A3L6TFF6_PANMI|nr:uncharacterized protein C2845_PM01G45330 [Panicum miliaceum]
MTKKSDHGRSKSAKEAWTEQQFIRVPSSCDCEEEDVEESDVPVDVPQQDEAQKAGYQGTKRLQAEEEHEALAQSSAPRMQQPCRVIQRTAADCFAAAASGAGDEDGLPCYMQLYQVSYGVKREAFGPIYLVT